MDDLSEIEDLLEQHTDAVVKLLSARRELMGLSSSRVQKMEEDAAAWKDRVESRIKELVQRQ